VQVAAVVQVRALMEKAEQVVEVTAQENHSLVQTELPIQALVAVVVTMTSEVGAHQVLVALVLLSFVTQHKEI
jgi:hypothetical protein